MLATDKFHINEAWIAVRMNDEFLFDKGEPYDMYVLMDVASRYVFGHVISKVIDETSSKKEIEDLLKRAWESKNQWAKILIVVENSTAESIFRPQAETKGIFIKTVHLSDLKPIINPLKLIWPWEWFQAIN